MTDVNIFKALKIHTKTKSIKLFFKNQHYDLFYSTESFSIVFKFIWGIMLLTARNMSLTTL